MMVTNTWRYGSLVRQSPEEDSISGCSSRYPGGPVGAGSTVEDRLRPCTTEPCAASEELGWCINSPLPGGCPQLHGEGMEHPSLSNSSPDR